MTAFELAMVMECKRGWLTRFELIRAVTAPILDSPSQKAIYSGLFSSNNATVSPFWKPSCLKYLAILLLNSST